MGSQLSVGFDRLRKLIELRMYINALISIRSVYVPAVMKAIS